MENINTIKIKMDYAGLPISSLLSLCMEYVVRNLRLFKGDYKCLKLLPPHIKDRMLQKFTSTSYFWKSIYFLDALTPFVHSLTKTIDLSLATIDDDILETLIICHNLRDVYLTRNANKSLSSQALIKFVSSCKKLHLLQVSNCSGVSDEVLISISINCPDLAGLDVAGCTNVTDIALEQMSNMQNLTWLTFSSTQVSNEGIRKLTSGHSGLKIKELRVANCKNVTSDVLSVIIEHCPYIEVLVFYNMQSNENDHQTYFPYQEGCLKHLKQLTWTVQW